MVDVYLASQSPRRYELLAQIGVSCRALRVQVDESAWPDETPGALVARLARAKANAGVAALRQSAQGAFADPDEMNDSAARLGSLAGSCVIGADTLVVCDGGVLGKPADAGDAHRMLRCLSGRTHQVMTAMAVETVAGVETRVSITDVTFRLLSEAERAAYIATGEPMDKAGAYGIQGLAGQFVTELRGSYSGVVGLALHHADLLLRAAGVRLLG